MCGIFFNFGKSSTQPTKPAETKEKKGKGKGVPGGKPNTLPGRFRLVSKVYFLTYKGTSDSGQKISKESLAHFLLHQNKATEKGLKPEKYLICQEMYDSGEPHFHVILMYEKRKEIKDPSHYDYLSIHPNITNMRNLKAALDYMYKEDPNPYTNMDILQERRKAKAKDSSSLYEFLREQMLKDPFNFDPIKFCVSHNLDREIYKANYAKALNLFKKTHTAYVNLYLSKKPGFQPITRDLITSTLTAQELKVYDSWSGYQRIVDHLNIMIQKKGNRDPKTPNLLLTGRPNCGKSALVWHPSPHSYFNPISAHCSVYPMGMRDWFPKYQSHVYHLIYWNEMTLSAYPYDLILQLLDGSPVQLPTKGGSHKKIDNPLVLMTSNMTLDQMIEHKFGKKKDMLDLAKKNLPIRVDNIIIPKGYNLFILQKLFVPYDRVLSPKSN